jgi:hypothetical protein
MRKVLVAVLLLAASSVARAQTPPEAAATPPITPSPSAQREGNESVMSVAAQTVPPGARLYVAPMPNGFDTYIVAGLQKKLVPVVVVTIREKADFEMTGVSETDKAGWAKMLIWGNDSTSETASVKLVNLKSGEVVFAYSVKKANSARGKQSAGESVAKHIKKKIEGS